MARLDSILFLYKSGRALRLAEGGPREFFYGFTEMAANGLDAQLAEEADFPLPAARGGLESLATRLLDPLAGLNGACLLRFSTRTALARLNEAAAVVATTNAQGLALGALKVLGRLTAPVLFLPMGVWPEGGNVLRSFLVKTWLRRLALAPIGRPEARRLAERLGSAGDVAYLPFGADARFWTPGDQPQAGEPYALAIGNDRHRDWQTLAQAWRPEFGLLKLVTRLPVPVSTGRIEVIEGDWNGRTLSDEAVRDLFRNARFVLLPLRETLQPSGQSACLQAMACGKAVILSAISGLWDERLLIDGETCLLVPPGAPEALAAAIEGLLADDETARRLGAAARRIVQDQFTVERMGTELAARLMVLAARARLHA